MEEIDVAVIGAGQAGLSSAYFLRRYGLDLRVIDAAQGPGGAWRHRSPSLTMDKVHGIFDLPGLKRTEIGHTGEVDGIGRIGEGGGRAARVVVPEYYGFYEREISLPVLRPVKVTAVARGPADRLIVTADAGEWAARAVVNATGTWTRPHWPYYPGAADFLGTQLHYASYRGPADFIGRRVVVVGGGASAMHVLSELAGVATTTWVTRHPPVWRDDDFGEEARREAVALVEARVRAGLPPQSVVSVTGLGYTPVVREALAKGALNRLPMFTRITPNGVTWSDDMAWPDGHQLAVDTIIWATGFRSALDHLAPLHLREPGGGIKLDGTQAVKEPRLHLVGYGPSASTIGANRAGRTAAHSIRTLLQPTPA